MRNWYLQGRYNLTYSGQYSISASYNAMLGELNRLRIADLIWTSVAQPRHRNDNVVSSTRQATYQGEDATQVMETQLHLFAHCTWLGKVKAGILPLANIQVYTGEVRQVLERIERKHWRQFYKEVVAAVWSAIVYHTWRARNCKLYRGTIVKSER
ncbi:hypothetical protein H5410_052167 [Solanum commersonii]|uniref:Uncharacterized protein n=1 Tax=Solanum commersonii TaxID=4109 RepID=A0A9J5X2L6_SOLCO|nr:hypothetical protein H5410_052167 [Solanum commersonii]